jgi:hypothetical protein
MTEQKSYWIKFGSFWLKEEDVICFEELELQNHIPRIRALMKIDEPYNGAFTLRGKECEDFKEWLSSQKKVS